MNIREILDEAWSKRRIGDYNGAKNLAKKAHERCADGDHNALGRIFHIYMQFESDNNHYVKALAYCQQSLGYYKKAGNIDKIAHSTRHIADLQRYLGQGVESESNYRKAINLYRKNPNTQKGDLANALRGFGIILENRKKLEEAKTTWEEVKKLYKDCNLPEGVDEANSRLNFLKY